MKKQGGWSATCKTANQAIEVADDARSGSHGSTLEAKLALMHVHSYSLRVRSTACGSHEPSAPNRRAQPRPAPQSAGQSQAAACPALLVLGARGLHRLGPGHRCSRGAASEDWPEPTSAEREAAEAEQGLALEDCAYLPGGHEERHFGRCPNRNRAKQVTSGATKHHDVGNHVAAFHADDCDTFDVDSDDEGG